jgi:hypothetical protein
MAIEYGNGWRLVSNSEFEEFLRRYPRPLTADPPLSKKSRFRRFLDVTLGPWPASQVPFTSEVRTVSMTRRTAAFRRTTTLAFNASFLSGKWCRSPGTITQSASGRGGWFRAGRN